MFNYLKSNSERIAIILANDAGLKSDMDFFRDYRTRKQEYLRAQSNLNYIDRENSTAKEEKLKHAINKLKETNGADETDMGHAYIQGDRVYLNSEEEIQKKKSLTAKIKDFTENSSLKKVSKYVSGITGTDDPELLNDVAHSLQNILNKRDLNREVYTKAFIMFSERIAQLTNKNFDRQLISEKFNDDYNTLHPDEVMYNMKMLFNECKKLDLKHANSESVKDIREIKYDQLRIEVFSSDIRSDKAPELNIQILKSQSVFRKAAVYLGIMSK